LTEKNKNIINLIGDIDDDFFRKLAVGISEANQKKDLEIVLMSDGGSVSVARGAYDLIRTFESNVYIKCFGEVSSSATLVLQAADFRIMYPNAKLMIHVGENGGGGSGHPRNDERLQEQNKIDETWMEDIYLKKIREKKPRFTRKKIKDMLEYDTYLNPKESLEFGLIDEIGVVK
jgi:ATP-dependent protease ClpP protease subunit